MAELPRHAAPHLTGLLALLLAAAASADPPDESPPPNRQAPRGSAVQAAPAARSQAQPSEARTNWQASEARTNWQASEARTNRQASEARTNWQASEARTNRQASQVELPGTWHVLVHYTDANSARPEVLRWEDRVWVFTPQGSRLGWSDYPIVVFRDETGRFEGLGGNRARRVLHAWEPNAAQRAQIASGLQVNPRGVKEKTLRGSPAQGWRSRVRAEPASASVITYAEDWSIQGLPARPVFERVDVLGSARTESLDGVTRYATTEVSADGSELRGSFERDGTRRGTFRMTRAGPVSGVQGSGGSQGERVYELRSPEGVERVEEGEIAP